MNTLPPEERERLRALYENRNESNVAHKHYEIEVMSLFPSILHTLEMVDGLREENARLRNGLVDVTAAFASTLMVVKELHGETDPDKRYEFANKHPEVIAARAILRLPPTTDERRRVS